MMRGYKKYFSETIRTRYPKAADQIISETETHYKAISIDTKFAKTSGNPVDKRLGFTSYFLALIKTLERRGESFEAIRKPCIEIVTECVRPKNRLQQYLKDFLPN